MSDIRLIKFYADMIYIEEVNGRIQELLEADCLKMVLETL